MISLEELRVAPVLLTAITIDTKPRKWRKRPQKWGTVSMSEIDSFSGRWRFVGYVGRDVSSSTILM
jgi:hypothetical protein